MIDINMEVPQKTKNRTTSGPPTPLFGMNSKKYKSTYKRDAKSCFSVSSDRVPAYQVCSPEFNPSMERERERKESTHPCLSYLYSQ
jgi:hypothetical protein